MAVTHLPEWLPRWTELLIWVSRAAGLGKANTQAEGLGMKEAQCQQQEKG